MIGAMNKKIRFILTQKKQNSLEKGLNQNGQVAVFVALIFQVIFVFFAVLINVGLLVHHKINLQQSTDLAAYYGAMKQAEGLNAIAHINFQIKQAWKLLTWRYRILGTFGFRKTNEPVQIPKQDFPFENIGTPPSFVYNGSQGANMNCPTVGNLGIQDIPFFCVGHAGFSSWWQDESNCQLDCTGFDGARAIGLVTEPGGSGTGSLLASVITTIQNINIGIQNKCQRLGPTGASLLTRFIAGYIAETNPRLRTIEALADNLTLAADKVLDIEGKTIYSGSLLTFKNNLTEANRTGFEDSDFTIKNGLTEGTGSGDCGFTDGLGNKGEFLKKIEIQFINYFIHSCQHTPGPTSVGSASYKPENVFSPSGGLGASFLPGPGGSGISLSEKAILESLVNPGQKHTVGYEKNPHCVEYYAVKTSATPQIPFLPLAKIKLNALAVAKPFGGSIGPWYGKTWPKNNGTSDPSSKTDENLPIKDHLSGGGAATSTTLSQSLNTQPNFSLYVGDTKGLRNLDYIAAYHSALAVRDFNIYDGKSYANQGTNELKNNGQWPNYSNWAGIDSMGGADPRNYDTLASNDPDKAGMRALEITAIAPNQFDITHYSIDPDFYNNYYRKLYKGGLSAILSATGKTGTMDRNQLRADFGAVGMEANQPGLAPLEVKTFSVKDQIFLKNQVLDIRPITSGPGAPTGTYSKVFNHLVSLQSSLLTGWTFLNFSNYKTFPSGPVDEDANTMSFGQCKNLWNDSTSSASYTDPNNYRTPMSIDANLPPTPGNCVTGGRTGYSVKIISPNMVRGSELENPIDDSFFSF